MGGDSHKRKYETAVGLYHDGKCLDALRLLDDLARDRPDSRHILYYRALCMIGLGRIEDACNRLTELSSFKDSSSKELADRLSTKIKPQLKTLYKKQSIELALMDMPLESDEHYEKPRRHPIARVAVIIALAIPCLLAAGFFAKAIQEQSDASMKDKVAVVPGVPDQFMDVTSFLPSRLDKPVDYLVCVASAGGITQRRDSELNNQAAASLIANWVEVRPNVQRVLKMTSTGGGKFGGMPESEMAHTIILPRRSALLSGDFQGREFETFSPGMATTLKGIISVCGEPDHNELWTSASRAVGIYGKTYWWRNVGVAIDSGESITHVLFRAYPQEPTV